MKFLDGSAIERLHAPARLIAAMRGAFAEGCEQPPRTHHAFGPDTDDGVLLLMPAWRTGEVIGLKAVAVMPRNGERGLPTVDGLYVLLDGSGAPRAVLDAKALTLARTAAVSAVAASLLAPIDTDTLLMVGTGALAPHLIRAHAAVRPYRRVLVWGRSPDKAAALADRMAAEGLPASPAPDLAAAVAEADVVSCATLSRTPLIHGGALKPGVHLDLVGAYTPQMREADDEAVRRAAVFADTLTALREAGDLLSPLQAGVIRPDQVTELASVVRAGGRDRLPGEITLFKAVGTALADLAAAEHFVGLHQLG